MFKQICAAAAVAVVASAAPALAESPVAGAPSADRGAATVALVEVCMASPNMGSYSVPEPACACGMGYVSARSTDRQYAIMARLAVHAADQAAMQAAVQAMVAEGYAPEEIEAAGQIMIDAGPFIDATCVGLQR